jgi:hypothetical protein
MKGNGLIVATLTFFVLINTSYYWEGKLGILAFPIFFALFIFYIILAFAFLRQLIFLFKETFKDKRRIVITVGLFLVLLLTLFNPSGFIDFDRLAGRDLLVATGEGGGNCITTLKFKEDNKFIEKTFCFGVTEIKGSYEIRKDTIFFKTSTWEDMLISTTVMQLSKKLILKMKKLLEHW